MSKKPIPLDDLEMHDLLRLIYPEHIIDELIAGEKK